MAHSLACGHASAPASASSLSVKTRSSPSTSSFRPQLGSPCSSIGQPLRLTHSCPRPCPSPSAVTPLAALSPAAVVCVADVKVATPSAEEVEFTWQGPGVEVLVTGDFLNWDSKLPLSKTADNKFTAKQKLPPGRYSYKFIVDGVWQHSQFHPTVADGAGGFNNSIVIEEPKKPERAPEAEEAPPPPPAAAAPAAKAGAPAGKKVAAGKAGGKKAAGKPIAAAMAEDIIPKLKETLSKEKGLTNISLAFDDNELRGSFTKNDIPYDFWAYFPDGVLDGVRGFSLTSCGQLPSTVEPFIVDERKITPELVVFWVTKRLFAQKLLSLN